MTRMWLAFFSGVVLFAALPAFAQVNFTGTSALTISADPQYPAPHSIVTLSAESPLLDLNASTIVWSVNGTPAGNGLSIRVPLGDFGQPTNVSVSVAGASGNDSATLTIIPASLDLLWEADSYVPPFYKGRAEVGSGSSIRVMALPHFANADGTAVPVSNITFTWKLNGAVLSAQSGLGESSATFPAAILYDSDTIDVVARAAGSGLAAESSIIIRTGSPELVLYEDNPLFGIMYHQALPRSSTAAESETSFAAVPYFAHATSANDPSLAYEWSVNDSPVSADAKDPSEITINAQSAGIAVIGLSITSAVDPFLSASGLWQVAFTEALNGGDVFKTAQ